MYYRPKRRYIYTSILFAGLTFYSHPVMTWFVFLSAASIFAFVGIDKTNIYRSVAVAGGVFLQKKRERHHTVLTSEI